MLLLPVVFALQQGVAQVAITTPPSGDTAGYWQQRADYRMIARLDERKQAAVGQAELAYWNNSPDTLREIYVYQYLNAFRPGSRWSAADEREGTVRFQHMADSVYGYERFTALPRIGGIDVKPEYPLAPDSTVVRLALPFPLAPGKHIDVDFEWEARPSTNVYRRQGRLMRHYDFAQWYPKVAVYDRGGWEVNAFVPAGELYGEFGTFDVTIIAREDQVLGATGVPVSGDPGWERVRTGGTVTIRRDAYGALPPGPPVTLAPGERAVRFYARDIHHFAWAASPYFKYEGGIYRDSIPVHVLYEPRGADGWANGKMVDYHQRALAWLESIYGPYPYPELLAIMRLDGGATEFPMAVMYGQNSGYGTVLHEVGHIYSYGALANNEWRSGWMDEGLTSYQTAWAQNATLPERAMGLGPKPSPPPKGYRAHAVKPPGWQQGEIDLFALDLTGRAEPIGTSGKDFNEFDIYQVSVYNRASMMYGALRNVLGDSLFRAFLKDYYAHWRLKHVDELAMRASAERVSGMKLDWFFAEWVHHTGLVDYAVRGDSAVKRDEYIHPMTIEHGQLDSAHLTPDWNARNNGEAHPTKWVFGWPFLDQWDRYRNVAEISPILWYTNPGGLTLGARVTTNYQKLVDKWDVGLAMAVRGPTSAALPQLQGWLSVENPILPWNDRPSIGLKTGAWMVDGTFRFELRQKWDESPFHYANGEQDTITLALNVTSPYARAWQDTARWSNATVADVSAEWKWRSRRPARWFARGAFDAGFDIPRAGTVSNGYFGTAQGEAGATLPLAAEGKLLAMLRAWGGVSSSAPPQRSLGLSSLDPTETFDNNYLRGQGAILVLPQVPYVPLGGAGMRGYSLYARVINAGSVNSQLAYTFNAPKAGTLVPRVQGALFGDVAYASLAGDSAGAQWLGDAGVSAILKGALYDRPYSLRIDLPIWLTDPELAPGAAASVDRVKLRWTFTVGDLW